MQQKETILCVDDEESIVKCLRRVLEPKGYRVLTALSGAEGLMLMEKERVDLVISDQRMPEMSGYEFLKVVRGKYPYCIRIMLSGYSDFESLVNTVNEGEIIRYISKPWSNEELLETIRSVLDQEKMISKVKELLKHTREVVEAAQGLKIETVQKGDTIILNITSQEKLKSEKEIYQLLEFLFRTFSEDNPEQFSVLSRSISKDKNTVVFDIDLGKGVRLKIIIPNVDLKVTQHN